MLKSNKNIKIYQNIREALLQLNNCGDWEITGPVIKSRECDIYRAHSLISDQILAIKHYHSHTNPTATMKQFEALNRYQHTILIEGQQYKIPRVFIHEKENRLLIMEWIPGKSFHHLLWRPISNNKQILSSVGGWLRAFHGASVIDSAPVNFGDYLKSVKKRIEMEEKDSLQASSSHRLFSESYKILKQYISNLPAANAPHAISHGDFTPSNIILKDEQVTGIDIWANTTRKPIYIDVARMTVYLTIAYPLFTRCLVFDARGRVPNDIMSFLEGYGTDLINPQSEHFKISLLSEYLRRWLSISNRPLTIKGTVTDKYQIARIKKQIHAISNLLGI